MRGLQLFRRAWRPCSLSAAVAPYTSSSCPTSTRGVAVAATVSYATRAPSPEYRAQRFYSTTHKRQSTSNEGSSHSNTAVCTSASSDATSDDAMDLIWSAMTDVYGQCDEANLTKSQQEHDAVESARATKRSSHEDDRASNANNTAASSPAPPTSWVWVSMHNMPRNWLHEDIVEMIHQVAEHAGVAIPVSSQASRPTSFREGDAVEEENEEYCTGDGASSVPNRMPSPFVRRLHIPFGRRTGLVYGSPKLLLASPQLADYLIHKLNFDPDDFRSRVYFTRTKLEDLPSGYQQQQQQHPCEGVGGRDDAANGDAIARVAYTPIEETVEREQDEALRTLELDRYLFAPDLLLDIVKSHQRRLVTKNEKVLLDAFVDGEEDSEEEEEGDDDDDDENDGAESGGSGTVSDAESAAVPTMRRRRQRRRATSSDGVRKTKKSRPARQRVRAGTQKHLGRGSMHNMPIPKPYVEGRNL